MVDPYAPSPAYLQVADGLRQDITSGRLGPGESLPSEDAIAHTYDVGRGTVRKAMAVLRGEGLVDAARGAPARVREPASLSTVKLPKGARVRLRMPSPAERAELRIPEGVPVAVVAVGADETLYPGDRFELVV